MRFANKRSSGRADRGESRIATAIRPTLEHHLRGQERPSIDQVVAHLRLLARSLAVKAPSRATVYKFIDRCRPHSYRIAKLPEHVRAALYNLEGGVIPGPQLVQYAFQYGDTRTASFAASLPWLDLHQADRLRGWREHSHGLLRAVMLRRGIS